MNQPFNEVKASSLAGVILDCNLTTGAKIGGGTATDNTAALNAFLATASATNPIKLILDGPTLVSAPLTISGNGYTVIEGIGWGSGIYVKSGSNCDALNNGAFPYGPTATPALTGSAPAQTGPVMIRNFMINGNRGNGTTGNSTSGDARGVSGVYWYANIVFYGVNGLRIEDMYAFDSPTYSIRLTNCSDVAIDRNSLYNPTVAGGQQCDGVHLDGPCTDVRIANNYINNNFSDDAIALNAPEGYAGGGIDRVTIVGNTFQNVYCALRIYGSTTNLIGSVLFDNNVGNVKNTAVVLGFPSGTGDINGRSVVISNSTFSVPGLAVCAFCYITSNVGDVTFDNCTWLSPTGAGSFILAGGGSYSSLTLRNCRIYRTTDGSNTSTTMLAASASSTIARLTIDGFYVVNQSGQSYAAIADLLAMTNVSIASLYIAALDLTNITALADSYTGITSLRGPGIFPSMQVATKRTGYTVLPTDGLLLADLTTGPFTFTPATTYAGQTLVLKKIDSGANALTFAGTVDGVSNPTLTTQNQIMRIRADGAAWWNV